MTYAELIDRLFVEYGDETEKIHGEPVSLIYLIGQVGEKQGYNTYSDFCLSEVFLRHLTVFW